MKKVRGSKVVQHKQPRFATHVTVKLPCQHVYQVSLSGFDLRRDAVVECPRCTAVGGDEL
jgi:hypothetical protein